MPNKIHLKWEWISGLLEKIDRSDSIALRKNFLTPGKEFPENWSTKKGFINSRINKHWEWIIPIKVSFSSEKDSWILRKIHEYWERFMNIEKGFMMLYLKRTKKITTYDHNFWERIHELLKEFIISNKKYSWTVIKGCIIIDKDSGKQRKDSETLRKVSEVFKRSSTTARKEKDSWML